MASAKTSRGRDVTIAATADFCESSRFMKGNLSLQGDFLDRVTQFSAPISIDGVSDCLTNAAAPRYFYRYLLQEIAHAERIKQEFIGIRLILSSSKVEILESEYEVALLNAFKTLKKSVRASDLVSRLGKIEFNIIFHGTETDVDFLLQRIRIEWQSQNFFLLVSHEQYRYLEGTRSFLRRLEERELIPL